MLRSGFAALLNCLGGTVRGAGSFAYRGLPRWTYSMSGEGERGEASPEGSASGSNEDTSAELVVKKEPGPDHKVTPTGQDGHEQKETDSGGTTSGGVVAARKDETEKDVPVGVPDEGDKGKGSAGKKDSKEEKDTVKDKPGSGRKNPSGARYQQSEGGGLFSFLKRSKTETKRDRQYFESLSLEEKRKLYKCRSNYVTLEDIETWPQTREKLGWNKKGSLPKPVFHPFPLLDRKVSLWRGDITKLEIGAIVNAANSSLLGGGGVDGAIHRAAGNSLYEECLTLNGCYTGQTKLTSGHALPAKYILHTVGPFDGSESDLRSCYSTCLDLVDKHSIKSVAFCCIATGVYGYPNDEAADVALTTIRQWLEGNAEKVDRIIFCVFLEKDFKLYKKKLHQYFPEENEENQKELLGETRENIDSSDKKKDDEEEVEDENDMEVSNNDTESSSVPSLSRSATEPTPSTLENMDTCDSHSTTTTTRDSAADDADTASDPNPDKRNEG